MAKLLKVNEVMEEGDFFNRWAHNRILKNKNILGAITGPTGSGKTYSLISLCENYYKNVLNMKFPIENICFSLGAVAKRLDSGELKTGEILILEEGGCNLGSLDFQNKMSKMFTYILQSFRSMNLGLIITLPVLTMLNKQTRLLIHFHFITESIDYETNICKLRPLFHQLNQQSGKSFWKYPRVRFNGRRRKITRLGFTLPSKELLKLYEREKNRFVSDITKDFINQCNADERANQLKELRKPMTELGKQIYDLQCKGYKNIEIARELKKDPAFITRTTQSNEKKGYKVVIDLK